MNLNKFAIYFHVIDDQIQNMSDVFSFYSHDMKDGINYLEYTLKPNHYEVVD